ncbi:hypothetical protein G7Y89_g11541 [Cudoniella acicularis]|uniref:Heterokaryon incompatibility domain-containing protein n=1 Tax=Cudoniella acicularis TaxID=354080 RepID=A0A8H4RAM5_9HELO|nr:hypothetical protein G7Y89_g11541 [Cudoniella acicularis]
MASNTQQSQTKTFHQPLTDSDEIRLLTLQPGTPYTDLRCTFTHVNLTAFHAPRYEALSYTWGTEAAVYPIHIEGNIYHIRSNLWIALNSLRSEAEERVIWIDALCINQSNILERNHQVKQMGRIYETAENVVVWLGPADHDSKDAFGFLSHGEEMPEGDRKSKAFSAVEGLLKREYWTRLWIIQEILLPTHIIIQCGKYSCDWKKLESFLNKLEQRTTKKYTTPAFEGFEAARITRNGEMAQNISPPTETTTAARFASARRKGWGRAQHKRPLFSLVVSYIDANCVEPLDKIFGLHALAAPCCCKASPVNYAETFPQVASKMIAHYILSHKEFSELHRAAENTHPPSLLRDLHIFRTHLAMTWSHYVPESRLLNRLDKGIGILKMECYSRGTVCYLSPPLDGCQTPDRESISTITSPGLAQYLYILLLKEQSLDPFATHELGLLFTIPALSEDTPPYQGEPAWEDFPLPIPRKLFLSRLVDLCKNLRLYKNSALYRDLIDPELLESDPTDKILEVNKDSSWVKTFKAWFNYFWSEASLAPSRSLQLTDTQQQHLWESILQIWFVFREAKIDPRKLQNLCPQAKGKTDVLRCRIGFADNGLMFYAPVEAQIGDRVCEAQSSNILLLARDDGENTHRFVGRCVNFIRSYPSVPARLFYGKFKRPPVMERIYLSARFEEIIRLTCVSEAGS